MRNLKAISIVLAVQLALFGCGKAKSSGAESSIASEDSQTSLAVNDEAENDVEKSDKDESISQTSGSQEDADIEEESYEFNPDLYKVYLLGEESINGFAEAPQMYNYTNIRDDRSKESRTVYTFVFETQPCENDDDIDSIQIIDKSTGTDIVTADGTTFTSDASKICYGEEDFDDVTSLDLIVLTTTTDYDVENLDVMIRTDGSKDSDNIETGWYSIGKPTNSFVSKPHFYTNQAIITINDENYLGSSGTGLLGATSDGIDYRYLQMMDLSNFKEPKATGLTSDDIVLMDKETLEKVDVPQNTKIVTFEKIDDGYVKLYYGFDNSNGFSEDEADELFDSTIPAIVGSDGQLIPLLYTHQFLGF